ncbi:hypothetical protein Vadar_019597 [Vaccinium darrowii]|uniref:Uncharacterized protein n=1 Tax=Vaccinium darrowii TaxID=229202 RepID=A0ACB7YER5_9ERIC|nr:hypothetical protein Vadar_019597 [Vaccinium darrowii]
MASQNQRNQQNQRNHPVVTVEMYVALQQQMKILNQTLQETQQQNQELRNQLQRSEERQPTHPQPSNHLPTHQDDQVEESRRAEDEESGQLRFTLTKEPPTTMAKLMLKAQQHMNVEDALNARQQILGNLYYDPDLKWPGKLRTDPNKWPRDKWCRFHRDHGHETDDCIDLKQQIEDLIQRVVKYWGRQVTTDQLNSNGILWKANPSKREDSPPSHFGGRG